MADILRGKTKKAKEKGTRSRPKQPHGRPHGENMVTKVAGFTQFVLSISKVLTTNYIIRIQSPNQPVSISTKKVAFL